MTAPSAPSSDRDHDRAVRRELARRLRPEGTATTPPPAPAAAYVRLRAIPPRPADIAGSAGWSRLLDWSVVAAGARAAILTDDRGLVIASAGAIDLEVAQGTAARLVIAFHQADRMSSTPSPAMTIQLDHGWLTGLRIDHGGEPLTLGVLGPAPLADAARREIARALADKVRGG